MNATGLSKRTGTKIKFNVILADPPWRYGNFKSDRTKKHGAVAPQYRTMTPDEIAALDIEGFAAKDAVLFLWTTGPHLREGLAVLEAWCFKYVTCVPWVKTVPRTGEIKRGVGFWTMHAAEYLLIGKRGTVRKIKKPSFARKDTPMGLLVGEPRVFYAPFTKKHSEKPLDYHEWIERSLRPPYVELFARRRRTGWTVVGDAFGSRLTGRKKRPSGR
jgi:N6-adenosine-specific RNA methylase IME4